MPLYTAKQAIDFIKLHRRYRLCQSKKHCIRTSNITVCVKICTIHDKETLGVMITKTATDSVNYVNHVNCTKLYLTVTKSLLSKIQQ